jgi:hypothetical protein
MMLMTAIDVANINSCIEVYEALRVPQQQQLGIESDPHIYRNIYVYIYCNETDHQMLYHHILI